ncbi:MAG TPA: SH3 domain-containing protein, partial [Thermomicrobiales bacterium]|nr:SH3 domain-containing protein [Thermomicrobiales bacterium]
MNGKRHDFFRRVFAILAVLLAMISLAPLSPAGAGASTDLTIGGWAVITAANGDHVRLRETPGPSYPVLGRYPEGTAVEVLDGPFTADDDGSLWYQVAVDGLSGYMAADYLAPADGGEPALDEAAADASPVVTGTAVIVNTNGDGIRCRAEPGTSAEILYRYVEGDIVDLRGDAVDGWQPVLCTGQAGYVATEFVGIGDSPDTGTDSGMGLIRGTNGDGVRCRAGADTDADIIVVLAEGTEVPLRGSLGGDWQPVTCAGQPGFVYSLYVGPLDDGSGGSGDDTGGDSNSVLEAGETAVVTGTNGDGVRLRAHAGFDGAVITVVGEGRPVEVRPGSTGDWVAVSYNGSDGFIHMDYLARGGSGGDDGGSGGGSGAIDSGDHAMATDNVRLRTEASMSGEVLAVVAASTVVVVTGTASDGFYPVDWDGLDGWMYADFLAWTDAPVTPRETGVGGEAGIDPGTADGRTVIDYAMNYLGYPYVYAT